MNRMDWLAIALLLATGGALAEDVQDAAPVDAPTASAPAMAGSVVRYPTMLGSHRLLKATYSPAQWTQGLTLQYGIAGAPEFLRFEIFLYPLGPAPTDVALAKIMDGVRIGIAEHEKQQDYRHVVFGDEGEFGLGEGAEALGRKLAMAFDSGDHRLMSIAYGFYRQLFLVKVRASVPDRAMEPEDFEAAADAATRDLVAALEVLHGDDDQAPRRPGFVEQEVAYPAN